MSQNKFLKILTLSMLLLANLSWSQFAIKKQSINSGGSTMTGGGFTMKSSMGQADASLLQSGGSFTLNGGFWHPLDRTPAPELIFKNSFEQ